MSQGTELYNRMASALLSALKDEALEFPRIMEALTGENLNADTLEPGTISTSDKLYMGRGALRRALIKGRTGNIVNVDYNLLNSQFEYGIDTNVIKYANTHEYGDTRPITPAMRRFFWAKFFETGLQLFKGLALTKKTTITWKPRPFLNPALKEFEAKELPNVLERIYIRLVIAFNS